MNTRIERWGEPWSNPIPFFLNGNNPACTTSNHLKVITMARRNSTPRFGCTLQAHKAICKRQPRSLTWSYKLPQWVLFFKKKKNHIQEAEFVKCWKDRGGSFFLSVWEEAKWHPRASMNYSSAVETEEDTKTHPKPNWKARAPLFIYLFHFASGTDSKARKSHFFD